MSGPPPPNVDFTRAHEDIWPSPPHLLREKTLRHIGIIVSKTGHTRGQKEMYLYSPTVKRDDGLIVCSNDFLNFEVGDWILFNVTVQQKKDEVYIGGKKWHNPVPTGKMFDCPMVKVRACMYPKEYSSIRSRQSTYRAWSPDLGDLFLDSGSQNAHLFKNDHKQMYNVTAAYHFNASIFNDGGPEYESKVYWRIQSVELPVNPKIDEMTSDWDLVPWRDHVFKYIEKRQEEGKWYNGVPPWYIRSTRFLTYDMMRTWEEEAKICYGREDMMDHPFPVSMKDGSLEAADFKETFTNMKKTQKALEKETMLHDHNANAQQSMYSWQEVMSFDGQILEPGSKMPLVSFDKKQKQFADRVELVQDSAGFFMSKAAAQSYVEIKETGTDKVWMNGGWKRHGEAWGQDGPGSRLGKKPIRVGELKEEDSPNLIRCEPRGPSGKNLLGTPKAKKPVAVKDSTVVPKSNVALAPPPPPVPVGVPAAERPSKLSFANAFRMSKDKSSDLVSDKSNGRVDRNKLNAEGRELYKKYKSLKDHVKGCEDEVNKEPIQKGFTAEQFIKAKKGTITVIQAVLGMGLREETEQDRETIAECTKKIIDTEKKLERGEIAANQMFEVHLSKEDDADLKFTLKAHVEFKKGELKEMKRRLLGMQTNESTC